MSDPLSDLLTVAGVRGALLSRSCMGAPYGVRTTGADGAIFHAMLRGGAWIAAEGGAFVRLERGDLALLPRGSGHVIADDPGTVPRSIRAYERREGTGLPVLVNGREADSDILCGTFQLGDPARDWVVAPLPDLLVVRGAGATTRYFDATLALLEEELATGQPGSSLVADRLIEVLVVHILRAWMQQEPDQLTGWLAAASEPGLARVMAEVHASPGDAWSVEDMARSAALSRSRFAEVFRDRMGCSPAAWLLDWRMALARRALREGADLVEAAERAGYASQATFGRAFKRSVGMSPGAWRRQVESAARTASGSRPKSAAS